MATRICLSLISALLVTTIAAGQEAVPAAGSSQICTVPRALTPQEVVQLKEQLNTLVVRLPHVAVVLVGVDALGRVAAAIDNDGDGVSEQLLMYTDQTRLEGPWSKRLRDADVQISNGSVAIASRQDRFAMSLAVSVADLPRTPKWAHKPVARGAGRELVRLFDDRGEGIPLSSLDHDSIDSWPEVFWDDLLSAVHADATGAGTQGSSDVASAVGGNPVPQGGCSSGQCCGTAIVRQAGSHHRIAQSAGAPERQARATCQAAQA